MGSYIKDPKLFNQLANEVQTNFGKIKPVGKFLNDNARIIVEVLDDKTIRISYRSMIYAASQQMFPILNEVEYKTAKKAAEQVIDQIKEDLSKKEIKVKIQLREELSNQSTQVVSVNYYRPSIQAYYFWSAIADVSNSRSDKE